MQWTGVLTLPIDQSISLPSDEMKCIADSFQLERGRQKQMKGCHEYEQVRSSQRLARAGMCVHMGKHTHKELAVETHLYLLPFHFLPHRHSDARRAVPNGLKLRRFVHNIDCVGYCSYHGAFSVVWVGRAEAEGQTPADSS